MDKDRIDKENRILSEIAAAVTVERDFEKIIEIFVRHLSQLFELDATSVFALGEDGEPYRHWYTETNDGCLVTVQPDTAASLNSPLIKETATYQVIQRDEPFIREDWEKPGRFAINPERAVSGFRSDILIPMHFRNDVIGVLTLASKKPGTYGKGDLPLLQRLADQLGPTIFNTRLLVDLEQRNEEILILNEIAAAVNSERDFQTIFEVFVHQLSRLLDFDATSLYLLGEDGRPYRGWIIERQEGDLSTTLIDYPIDDSPGSSDPAHDPISPKTATLRVLATGEPFLRRDWRVADEFELNPNRQAAGMLSDIILPLKFRQRVIGLLTLASRTPDAYTEKDIPLLRQLTEHLVLAIHNTRLLKDLEAQNSELETNRSELVIKNEELERATSKVSRINQELQEEMAERQRVERSLVKLERLRALGEISAGVSHNLNNILTSIIGPAQLLRRTATEPQQLTQIDRIITSANRAADLVRRLHLSTRTGKSVEVESVSVAKIVEEAIHVIRPRWQDEAESRGITIEVMNEATDGPPVRGTESGLHEILVNLLLNGLDAMPEGGVMTLQSRAEVDSMLLTVADTGVGMDSETLRRVFEPFFTTKADVGTGLGMSTAFAEVTRWGGTLDVESEPGKGTTFTVRLPLWEGPANVKGAPAPADLPRRARVLIVDDDDDVRQLLFALLDMRHDVVAAASGADGLDAAAAGKYDVALIDLGLPEIPGNEVARRMREIDPALGLILITGWQLDEDDPRTSAFDFRLQKPFMGLVEVEKTVGEAIQICDRRRSQ